MLCRMRNSIDFISMQEVIARFFDAVINQTDRNAAPHKKALR